MTKADLIRSLEGYPDDKQVLFTAPGAAHYFYVNEVKKDEKGVLYIEPDDAPTFEDICGMAGACLDEWRSNMTGLEIDLLTNVADGAYKEDMRRCFG